MSNFAQFSIGTTLLVAGLLFMLVMAQAGLEPKFQWAASAVGLAVCLAGALFATLAAVREHDLMLKKKQQTGDHHGDA
jgi:hypothetical protein